MDHLCSLIRGVPISIRGAFIPALDCWWPPKKSRGCGEVAPAGLLSPSPHLRCTWFTVCGSRLIHCCVSAPWAGCHSTPGGSLGIWGGIFWCTHAHAYQHSALSRCCHAASGFWRGDRAVMNVSFLPCFHDFGWRAERCAVLLTGDYCLVNETPAYVWDTEGTILSLRYWGSSSSAYLPVS